MKSNETKKLLAMAHIVFAVIAFAVALWQIAIFKDFALKSSMNTPPLHVFYRMLTLSGLLWSVALATCAISLLTDKRRTFCQLISVVNLFLFPIGTIIGGFTLYTLRISEKTFTINEVK